MKLEILCSGCKKELTTMDVTLTPLGTLKIVIVPCRNLDCYDCGGCEEMMAREEAEQELKKLKERLGENEE